jgi:hypothetical protein
MSHLGVITRSKPAWLAGISEKRRWAFHRGFSDILQSIALMAGEAAFLLFSQMTVPILYYLDKRWESGSKKEEAGAHPVDMCIRMM